MNDASLTKAPARVIALEWNVPMLVDVLVELSREYGWQPLYCVSYNLEEYVRQRFPSIVYHQTHDARYGIPPPELADMPRAVIDQPAAEALSYAEVMALKQMDRMELMGEFALHDRFLHFHRLAGYWSAVFDRIRPDVLLMPSAPHVTYDYIAYALARQRGIRIVLFEFVAVEGLLMAIDGFEDGLPPLMEEYRRLQANPAAVPVVLSEQMESYLQRMRGTYDEAIPRWHRLMRKVSADFERSQEEVRQRFEEASKLAAMSTVHPLQQLGRNLRSELALTLRSPGRIARLPIAVRDALRAARQPPSPSSPPALPPVPATEGHYKGQFYQSAPEELARKAAAYRRRHVEVLRERYDELAVVPDLDQPYVYVALHAQPERSTNPSGGVFDNQNVMVDLIAAALPEGWRVYVKDHPTQFLGVFSSERGRSASLYDAFLSNPAVSLVSRKVSSFDLIDRARAVATIAGTSCWEAIVRGTPALVFGEAWYKGCDGSYTVRTVEDCRHALAQIAAGRRPDPEAVRRFLFAAERTSFVGYLNADDEAYAGIDATTNVQRLARAIVERYAAGSLQAQLPERVADGPAAATHRPDSP